MLRRRRLRVWAIFIGIFVTAAVMDGAQSDPAPKATADWEQRLAARHDELVAKNGPGTDTSLRGQLLRMGDEDQKARGFANGKPIDPNKVTVAPDLDKIDGRLTAELKQIVGAHGWPTISLVGINASNDAMLILIHSADHAWQSELLPSLEQLAKADKIDGSGLALVIDKELVAAGKAQRYGTQFKFTGDGMQLFEVEDPGDLDARRERMLLPPMDAYRQLMADIYHKKLLAGMARPEGAAPGK